MATSQAIRVVVVDDSSTMRRLIRAGLEQDPQIEVVAEACNAREARDAVKALAPDVLTLDIEMPGMNGLEFLERLMRARPTPVIMFSTLTSAGSDEAVRALSLGAFDCLGKPKFGTAQATMNRVTELVKAAARARVDARNYQVRLRPVQTDANWRWNGKLVMIGSSTGGVEALQTVLSDYPANCPPTMITQHMPPRFLASLAARLDTIVAPNVRLARDGERLEQGVVYIAPGGETHLHLDPTGQRIKLHAGDKRSGHRPSVDSMFGSAVPHANNIIAAILTGMGHDGAEEMLALHQGGANCVGQNEQTSVVYGMPRVANEMGGVDTELPITEIASYLLRRASK
ncbi:MAG: chemotaxis response regulator protein-glutamate methylesterase [Maritimibacter sp.]